MRPLSLQRLTAIEADPPCVTFSEMRTFIALAKAHDDLVAALQAVKSWAAQRCPCNNDAPRICPLCDANVETDRCGAVDASFPKRVREQISAALAKAEGRS